LPPDIYESEKKFSVKDGRIRFGLLGVKNVGENAVEAILKARAEKGAPGSISEFINNVNINEINKKTIESLIFAGALDCLNPNRAAHIAVYEKLLESAQSGARKMVEGQISLFQLNGAEMRGVVGGESLPLVEDFDKPVRMAREKEMLGIYLTGHPLADSLDIIDKISNITTDEIIHFQENPNLKDNMEILMVAVISDKKTQVTKNGRIMAFLGIEDMVGGVEAIVFPNVYEKCTAAIFEDAIVVLRGKLSFKDEETPKIIADKITPVAVAEEFYRRKEREESARVAM
jgi:DNA polymerase-3 subunit alpha